MKYIAVFDIPDDYAVGCACVKIAPKGKEVYKDSDFDNCYADIEPLSGEKAEVFEKYNTTERIMQDLGLSCAYDMPSFWSSDRKSYTVIPTKYHKGYMKALEDIEREIRSRFGFAERDEAMIDHIFEFDKEAEELNGRADDE